jgi:hypothetical protein
MSASQALALDCRTLEKDATPAASLLIVCAGCDPDNPRGVALERCKKCHGSGFTAPELIPIVEELHASRLELLRGGRDRSYGDSDD